MPTVKQFLVGAIGLVITLVIIGTGVGVYRAVKPVADFATEGVNTLAGEMTSKYYTYNGKTMTGQQIKDDATLSVLKADDDKAFTVGRHFKEKESGTTLSDAITTEGTAKTYSITVNWDSKTNTFESITVKLVNR